MITKSDWQAVHQEMTADQRRKLGEPPTTEEMLAYSRGELSANDAERVRAWLVFNPEMARALTQPFPEDDAQPGDPDFLSEAELAKRWTSLQQHIHGAETVAPRREGRVLRFSPVWTALAAALALVFGGLFWQAKTELRRLTTQPWAVETQVLEAGAQRGAGGHAITVECNGDFMSFVATLPNSGFDRYRIEMTDVTSVSPRRWKDTVRAGDDGVMTVLVPCGYLKPGRYDLVSYGLTGANGEQRLDGYEVRVK
jgi:hypothetical protein